MTKKLKWPLILSGSVTLLLFTIFDVLRIGSVNVPPLEQADVVYLDQNWPRGWKPGESDWFHHASQGTQILRYRWFMALEQPDITVFTTPELFSSPEYLQRFGFLPSERFVPDNPDGLPIGFAVESAFQEPYSSVKIDEEEDSAPQYLIKPYAVVGLTCAGCHTGQVNYQGKGIRIEGGQALVNLGLFQEALSRALFYTRWMPSRFHRFARRVLDEGYSDDEQVDELKRSLEQKVDSGVADLKYATKAHLNDLKSGFGRTDALGLIANRAFRDFDVQNNLAVTNAPVSFPPIWDTPWHDWVQYNGSIRLPMVRNIGEVLGVGGMTNFTRARGRMWLSSVNVRNLHDMEAQIAGPKPFEGLRSPIWPSALLGSPIADKVERGRELYESHCARCHVTVPELQKSLVGEDPKRLWHTPHQDIAERYPGQGRFIGLKFSNLDAIGTDPGQALNFVRRVVHTDKASLISGADALSTATDAIRDQKYTELGLDAEQTLAYDGYRRPKPVDAAAKTNADDGMDTASEGDRDELSAEDGQALVARLGYKARPLNGIWATAPYLHNGSVPNLYEMLLPVEQRTERFFVGSREFDPKNVGLATDRSASGFSMDTSLQGNLNIGHEFRNLTLSEFETYRKSNGLPIATEPDITVRWATVLEIEPSEYKKLTKKGIWARQTAGTAKALKSRTATPEIAHVSGLLGPEFSDDERWAIVEYLKTL